MEYWLVVRWLVVYLSLFVVGLPLAAALCPRLPNRGTGIALPISLAIIGIVVYWIGHLSFGWMIFVIALFVLGCLSLIVYYRVDIEIERRPAIETAVVFTIAFSFLVAVRAVDPAVHPAGGEKFLDYGLLRSLLRASALPPEDFWFAGKPVEYYYGGHMLSTILAELTFTKARYAYNLALAGFYAMLVSAVYGLAGSLGERIGTARLTAGAFGAFFVGFASNLQTPLRGLLLVLPEEIAQNIADVGIAFAGLAVSPTRFSYWNASRVIPITPSDPDSYKIPTEFPLFSWLNGDLHAHMMSTPFLLLVATLCFSYYLTSNEKRTQRRLLLCAIAVFSGLIAVINTWSFPTVFGLTWLTLTFSPSDPLSLLPTQFADRFPSSQKWSTRELRRSGGSLLLVIPLVLVGIVVSLPFWLGAVGSRGIAIVSERTPLLKLFIVHGGFLLVFVPHLYGRARTILSRKTLVIAALLLVPIGVISVWIDFAALVLIGSVALASWALLRIDRNRDIVGFPAILLLAGAGLVLLVEIVYLRERAGPGRYNTMFKTYMQVWILWSPPAGAALARIARPSQPLSVKSPFSLADRATFLSQRPSIRQLSTLLAVLLVCTTSIYGCLALTNHFSDDGYGRVDNPTLDSLAFVETYHPGEAQAIYWLNSLPGQPVIAAAPGLDSYGWTNPESTLTGLPTIVGWTHEIGYRNESVYFARVKDVDALYQGPPKRTIEMLRKYDVQYIYVGPRERERYDHISFDRIAGIEVAKRFDSVVIYEVHQNELAVQPSNETKSLAVDRPDIEHPTHMRY
jgi:YYY domain-containing protein